MLQTRSRGRFEPPEVYSTSPVGVCPECGNDVDEDEPHETLDGRITHKECLPFCTRCGDALMHDLCDEGCNIVSPILIGWITEISTGKRLGPAYDYSFAGIFCDDCLTRQFFPEGDE